jgi:uncharacterized protein
MSEPGLSEPGISEQAGPEPAAAGPAEGTAGEVGPPASASGDARSWCNVGGRGVGWRYLAWRAARLVVIVLATVTVITVVFENRFIYFPTREGRWDLPQRADLPISLIDCHFTTEDGVELHAWYAQPRAGRDAEVEAGRRPVLLLFHGNAGNLSDRYEMLIDVCRLGFDVMIVGYRGYGRSGGRPSEEGLYRDASAAWRFLTETRGVAASRVVLWGKSIGGAVAIELATRVQPAGLIVQSTFTSVSAMAATHYWFIPRFLVRHELDSLSRIGQVDCPVLVIHGREDRIVPFSHGQALFAAAPQPKRWLAVPEADHNDLMVVGWWAWREAVEGFVGDIVAQD